MEIFLKGYFKHMLKLSKKYYLLSPKDKYQALYQNPNLKMSLVQKKAQNLYKVYNFIEYIIL